MEYYTRNCSGNFTLPESDRCILHIDMDCFFASVEVLDNLAYKDLPIIVGGDSERGVVASCSYQARAYGVRSAMSVNIAKTKCPDAIVVPVRHQRYREVSQALMEILHRYSCQVESVGLDEAYLDFTNLDVNESVLCEIAHQLRTGIKVSLGLDCSIGIGNSKLLAKLASRRAKPTAKLESSENHRLIPVVTDGVGVFIVVRGTEQDFIDSHSPGDLPGIGPATRKKLTQMGVSSVADLRLVPYASLHSRLGNKLARRVFDMARGVDPRSVAPNVRAKSISSEETFSSDLASIELLRPSLVRAVEEVASKLYCSGKAARTVSLKLKTSQFQVIERSQTLPNATFDSLEILDIAQRLISPLLGKGPFRLLGVTVSHFVPIDSSYIQTSFEIDKADGAGDFTGLESSRRKRNTDLVRAVEDVKKRFGPQALIAGELLKK